MYIIHIYASKQIEAHICTTFTVSQVLLYTFSIFLFKTDMWDKYYSYFTVGNRPRHYSVL